MSNTNPVSNEATPAQLAAHTDQALVELVYVQTANDMIGGAFANLDNALNTTQSILNILQGLQNLHNEVTVKSKSAFNFNFATGPSSVINANLSNAFTGAPGQVASRLTMGIRITLVADQRATVHFCANITAYEAAYNKAASAYFGQPINPTFSFSSPNAAGYTNYVDTLKSLKQKLSDEITALTQQTPPSARSDPTSLLGTLKTVLSELPTNFQFSTVSKWALDNYDAHGSTTTSLAGNLENDLTTAITAAQSLNNTQTEKVRRYLFIFQEYYQSASAVLTGINQVITQMAQKISGS